MRLAPFQLHRPAELEAALALREQFGDDSAYYAGGTELLLALKARVLRYEHLIDLKRIAGFDRLALEGNELVIGPLVTHLRLATDPLVCERLPAYAALSNNVGNIRVRASGTLAGNLCFSEPHADPPALLCLLGATLTLQGEGGERRCFALSRLDRLHRRPSDSCRAGRGRARWCAAQRVGRRAAASCRGDSG